FQNVKQFVCRWGTRMGVAMGSLWLLWGAVTAQVPDALFVAGRIEYPLDRGLLGITKGDFNGDGRMDIAVANSESSTFTILLSNNCGGYTPSTLRLAPENRFPRGQFIVAKDFDGDNKLDLAITTYEPKADENNVLFFKGDGNGRFDPLPNLNFRVEP